MPGGYLGSKCLDTLFILITFFAAPLNLFLSGFFCVDLNLSSAFNFSLWAFTVNLILFLLGLVFELHSL